MLTVAGAATASAPVRVILTVFPIKPLAMLFEQFHRGQEPDDPMQRGRWLGDLYAESDARLNYRKEVLAFLLLLSKEDQNFVSAIDRLLKMLWRKNTEGEDIAYLLGRLTNQQEINADLFREQDVIVKFWPIIGDFLRDAVENPKPYAPVEGEGGSDE